MRLPETVQETVEEVLDSHITEVTPVGGGCIANASRVDAPNGRFFLKWAAGPAGVTFVAEGEGLAALRSQASRLWVPRPLFMQNADDATPGILLMEWIDEEGKSRRFWENLGRGLAEMHRVTTSGGFGFEMDNFIGRLPQRNVVHDDWIDFFRDERILPQVAMARKGGRWQSSWDVGLDGLVRRLPSLIPSRPHASLVHGDLWAGNVLGAKADRAAVIDPAVYRGDREVDIAMSQLFGGFSPAFYNAYDEVWELNPGYNERREVYNLYHLINHLNHFGSSYAGQIASVLSRF